MRRKLVAILGGRLENTGPEAMAFAEAIGRELAQRGYGLVTGGDGGIANAACKGAVEAGGQTIALLKFNKPTDCGPYTTWAIPTSMDLARSNPLNWAGDGIIAFDGRFGTMGEIALALDTERPLVVTGDPTLLTDAAFDVPTCRVIRGNALANVMLVVDTLEKLMDDAVVPPTRPDATPGLP
ncbi:hypothetical protein [Catellatospora sp. NPDC049609]|uniref:SLOG cluster 4 domain-containing protein n=1 Tax=Catellatospora sp. NPDC049609 TaxID=3155505 RepID=UPI0034133D02